MRDEPKQERKEKSNMKKVLFVLVGVLGVLSVAALMPKTSYAFDPYLIRPVDNIVTLAPSESMPVDTTAPKFVATPSYHESDVSESRKFDATVPKFVATPSYHSLDVSESQPQPIDAGISASKATAATPKKCVGC